MGGRDAGEGWGGMGGGMGRREIQRAEFDELGFDKNVFSPNKDTPN